MSWTEEEKQTVDSAIESVNTYGTDRVLTSNRSTTVPFSHRDEFNIEVEVVFLRDDGWTLGCHRMHLTTAWNMNQDRWIAVMIKPENHFRPISEVREKGDSLFEGILEPWNKFKKYPRSASKPKPGGVGGIWSYVGKPEDREGPEGPDQNQGIREV